MNLKVKDKVKDKVKILTSILGKDGEVGIITAKWGDVIQVDFNGHLGQYTISKHEIEKVIYEN